MTNNSTTTQRQSRVRRLAITGALGLGLALMPAQMAGAEAGTGPEDTPADFTPKLCYYDGKSYSPGSIVKFSNGKDYYCLDTGYWRLATANDAEDPIEGSDNLAV